MKFIIYVILFYLVYRYFSRLGRLEEKIDRLSNQKEKPVKEKKKENDKGEYIDYEEIK